VFYGTLASIVILVCSVYPCAADGKPPKGTVNLDEALASCAEKLRASVSGKTEIVIAAIKAPDDKTADFLAAELTSHLMESGSFIVLERGDALKAVNAEHEFQMSGLVSDKSVVGIGHHLGAKVVVTGTFEPYADFSQLRLRAIDVKSSRLLAMPSSRINSKDKILANIMPKDIKPQRIKNEQTLDHLSRGKDFDREGKYDEAIREYDEAIRLDPNNAAAYHQRAIAYAWNKKDYNAAIADFTKAISIGGNNTAFMYYMRGAVYYQFIQDYDKAIADFTQSIKLNPNHVESYELRAVIYERKEDYDQAIRDLTQAIKLAPNDLTLYNQRAGVYSNYSNEKKNYDLAIADYTQVIKLAHKEKEVLVVAYMGRGKAYENKKDYDNAITDYSQLINIGDQKYVEIGYSYRGQLYYYKKKDYDKAIADFTGVLKIKPNDAEYFLRGESYFAKKDYNRAIADYESVLKLPKPDDLWVRLSKEALEKARQAQGN
jgi:tetratricopeptide (TPR) repeat protein